MADFSIESRVYAIEQFVKLIWVNELVEDPSKIERFEELISTSLHPPSDSLDAECNQVMTSFARDIAKHAGFAADALE